MDKKIQDIQAIMGMDGKMPARNVKVEKKEKGLFERTKESTILITEDNKMILND